MLVLAVGCGGTAKKPGGPKTPKDIVKQASPAIVRVETGDGLGTGFIIDKAGIVATNLHVVRGKKEIHVRLYGGDTYDVTQVVGVDPARDLALLRIQVPKPLPTLKLGDSDALSPGDQVVAIGNPLGVFDYSVSAGLVSQIRPVCTKEAVAYHNAHQSRFEELIQKRERTAAEDDELEKLQCSQELTILQISAPISQGSSGGPLFNQSGEVVGVTTLIVTQGQNINFAIPANYIKPIVKAPLKLTMAEFAEKTGRDDSPGGGGDDGPKIVRNVPHHDPAQVFKGCSGQQIADLVQSIWDAIEVGAPLYNQGTDKGHEACFRIYEGTATKFEQSGPCPGVKTAFGNGLLAANTKQSYKEKAWAMRDTFDGLLNAAKAWATAPGNNLPQPAPKKKP
jgi:serine protease Do